ncbi:hypothetical protein UFOVP71_447 [uncultured Caudovirales phage]|uniref:Uncharacterized protein n=1 Tax=uncultured Caudovirales phage TaxID=2100421 RepID=A0A6J5TC72_9CAUD|nr:hypothetical protein UFOVP71_447 [uncultured Caudovirales phage]
MNKNSELRNSLLFFVDEAIGFRKSLHHFHRWLETGEQSELEALIIEVGREHFVDLWPLLNFVKDDNHADGLIALKAARERGLYVPRSWAKKLVRLTPLTVDLFSSETDIFQNTTKAWALRDWIDSNKTRVDPLSVLGMQLQLLMDSKTDFFKLFELLDMFFGDTLLSCVINDDINFFAQMVSEYYPSQQEYINKLSAAIIDNPDLNWKDALSRNQIKSKLWLIEKLSELDIIPKTRKVTEHETTTLIVGGWVGMIPFLSNMLGKNLDSVINVDIDTSVHDAASKLNIGTHNKFRNAGNDIREINLSTYKKLLIVDTIVEHFKDHGDWVKTLPKGTTVILQGNDMFDVPDHVNCHNSLEEFLDGCGLNTILWSGELNLYKCTRFMAIGKV